MNQKKTKKTNMYVIFFYGFERNKWSQFEQLINSQLKVHSLASLECGGLSLCFFGISLQNFLEGLGKFSHS